jgi:hypothetical protein
MKIVKMSLVAALLVGSSAFALDKMKYTGDAKLFYSTADMGNADLFDQASAMGHAALDLGVTADLAGGAVAGVSTTALSTLGLENNVVGAVWASGSTATQWWVSEAYIAKTFGKTTAKVGRQTLDTPFAFTETWNAAYNTFDAIVLLNQDIPDTTIVAANVGKHNGNSGFAVVQPTDTGAGVVDSFGTFALDGAYALGVVNNSFKPLTAQAWYYNVSKAADAMWVQADLACEKVKGLVAGVQYASIANKGVLDGMDDSSAFAAKIGYEAEKFSVSAAFSQTDDKGTLQIANVATMDLNLASPTAGGGGAASKLYTEAWWNFGYVGAADTTAMNLTATYDAGFAGFGAYITSTSADAANVDMMEVTLEATKSFDALDTGLYYIHSDADDMNAGDAFSTVQVYLTYNF